jgi:hypothetical protein
VGDVGKHRLEWEGMQMVYDVEYVGMLADSGIEEASFVVRLIHGEKDQIHHRRHHRHPSFPSH